MNFEMLDLLAQPGGFSLALAPGAERPPARNEVFNYVARHHSAPRSPAFGAELERLEPSVIRGDCISPLLVAGDVIYVDHAARPLPGDIVTFRLSQRFADDQNAAPPPGQSPTWKKGDGWAKLFVPFAGIDMLRDRHGGSVTATYAACESPDDVPALGVVRNVRRAGALLFLP